MPRRGRDRWTDGGGSQESQEKGDVREQWGRAERNSSEDDHGGCEIRNNYDLERIIPTCFSMRGSSDSLKLLLQWFEERQLP